MLNSFSLFMACRLRKHGNHAFRLLPRKLGVTNPKKIKFSFILVVNGHKHEWCIPIQEALTLALRPIIKTLLASYNKHINLNQDILNILVKELNNKYDNINIFVNRNPTFVYNPNGRTQKDVAEAIERDIDIKNQLEHFNTSFTEIMCSEFIVTDILRKVLNIGN